jgi:putative pyruvate formate lyase activating enzyme
MEPFAEYSECRLCPRDCRADRQAGRRGICGETAELRCANACAHFGEEPCLSGTRGSGTIFFSGCSCRCFFCQNYQISREGLGTVRTPDQLFADAMALIGQGVHNLNFVTPDHFEPHVRHLCGQLRDAGITVPFIWNGSGYHLSRLVGRWAEYITIFLPDFKFAVPDLARRCMDDADYPRLALESLRRMVRERGFLKSSDDGGVMLAERGVLVRHLVLPGETENSLKVIELLHGEFGPDLPLSVMSQFHPVPACHEIGCLNRQVAADDYRRVCDRVFELGFSQVFLQPESGDTAFLPDFSDEHPFAGNPRQSGGAAAKGDL